MGSFFSSPAEVPTPISEVFFEMMETNKQVLMHFRCDLLNKSRPSEKYCNGLIAQYALAHYFNAIDFTLEEINQGKCSVTPLQQMYINDYRKLGELIQHDIEHVTSTHQERIDEYLRLAKINKV